MVPKQPKLSLKNRALRFLSLREHSRLELGRKLARFAEEGDDVEALLDFLEEKRFLSCERFSESLIRRRSENFGNQRILAELQTHGLGSRLSEGSMAELAESEVERARAVWQKKFGRTAKLSNEKSNAESNAESNKESDQRDSLSNDAGSAREQRAKEIRYLMARGFSGGAIKAALRGNVDEPDAVE
jgi:regulatory protein